MAQNDNREREEPGEDIGFEDKLVEKIKQESSNLNLYQSFFIFGVEKKDILQVFNQGRPNTTWRTSCP